MALNDKGYVIPARGMVYRAPVGTATPSDLNNPGEPFEVIGHVGTADGDGLPNFTSDGGDVTVMGSWSRKAIRTITEPLTEQLEFGITQLDETGLRWYTSADGGNVAGQFQAFGEEINQGVETALLVVIIDGQTRVGFYAPKVSVNRGDDIEFDNEAPVTLPVAATLLDVDEATPRYTWIADFINADATGN